MIKADYKKIGYRFLENDIVEFYCDKELYEEILPNEDVYITASFNGWLSTGDSSWKLAKKEEKHKTYFVLQKNRSSVSIPGNSGFPEFRFFALSGEGSRVLLEKEQIEGFTVLNNKLILDSEDECEIVKQMQEKATYVKTLDDFDLNCPACRAELSNVRLVPGTKCLFRGYHPFKKSRPDMDTEDARLKLVQKAFDIYGIKCDITLSGAERADKYADETFPSQIENIEKKENRLCVNIDYNLVYYHAEAVEYLNTLQKISKFIIEKTGPYYVHCRLGSDRTGVTCAVFAALCGATWKEIAEDYEKTSNMGMKEFRNRRLLQYSLKNMTGKDPSSVKDLAKLMQSFFISENILKASELEKLIKKLNTAPRKKETDYFDFDNNHICAKKTANI